MPNRIAAHVRRQAVGYLALVVALSGTAYAANRVTGRDIGPIKQRDSGLATVSPGEYRQASVSCKKEEVALGFGVSQSEGGGVLPMRISSFTEGKRGLVAAVFNDVGQPRTFRLTVSCLKK